MDSDNDIASLDSLERFIKEQEMRLEEDKKNERLKNQLSVNNHEGKVYNNNNKSYNTLPQPKNPVKNQSSDKKMVENKSGGYVLINSREKEREKLINVLSVPKSRHSCPNIKALNKADHPFNLNKSDFTIDCREREKDRLAEIFASSSYKFSRASNYQISKNLDSKICLEGNHHLDLSKVTAEYSKGKGTQNSPQNQKNDYLTKDPILISKDQAQNNNQKYIPQIFVSEHQEEGSRRQPKSTSDHKMVRIGEFSPLNPSHPAGKPILGVGEHEETRKLLLDQRKQEYHEYLQQQSNQMSTSHTPTREQSLHNHHLRDAFTQTEWESEAAYNPVMQGSPRHISNTSCQTGEKLCSSPCMLPPVPKCFEGLSEKEIKEYLYREELRKQIEEKNRLREEMKRREAEEEAKLEEKIRRDQEEMKRQFEAERLQRLELAFRKKEQEDILRQRLFAEQQKAFQESKNKKKPTLGEKSTSPNDNQTSSVSRQPDHRFTSLSQSMPAPFAAKAIADVDEVLRQPLLKNQRHHPSAQTLGQNSPREFESSDQISALDQPLDANRKSITMASPPIHKVKEVDLLAQKTVFDSNTEINSLQEAEIEPHHHRYGSINQKRKEVNELLKRPLLAESFQVLPPMSPPLLHATIPPVNPSLHPHVSRPRSPPAHASKRVGRTDSEILEDRWKVPYVERYNVAPSDVSTKHNRSVLTQLGAFRKHLQEERLRMQQRVKDDSP